MNSRKIYIINIKDHTTLSLRGEWQLGYNVYAMTNKNKTIRMNRCLDNMNSRKNEIQLEYNVYAMTNTNKPFGCTGAWTI